MYINAPTPELWRCADQLRRVDLLRAADWRRSRPPNYRGMR